MSRLPHGWKIVLPALVFNTVYFVISCTAATILYNGFEYFCAKFSQDIINKESCKNLDSYLKHGPKQFRSLLGVYGSLFVAQIASSVSCGLWFLAVVLLLVRVCCAADFQLVQVTTYMLEESQPMTLKRPLDEETELGVSSSDDLSVLKLRKKARTDIH